MEKKNLWDIYINRIYKFFIQKNFININNQKNRNKYSKKKPNNPKRDKYFIFIKFCLLLFFFNYLLYNIFIKEKVNSSEIIESKSYDKFENIKLRFIINSKLKPYLDYITILNHIYNKNYKIIKKNKINVNICVSFNNRYVYSTLVSIESILFNCNKKKTFITCHILCSPDVKNDTLFILKSLNFWNNIEGKLISFCPISNINSNNKVNLSISSKLRNNFL